MAPENITEARQGNSRYSSASETAFLQAIKETIASNHDLN